MKRENIDKIKKIVKRLEFIEERLKDLEHTKTISFLCEENCELFSVTQDDYLKGSTDWIKKKYLDMKEQLENELIPL